MAETLLVSAFFAFAAAAIFATVGARVQRREAPQAHRWALQLFAIWWYALAGSTAISGTLSLLARSGRADLDLFVAATYTNILLICIALWGLLAYLLYLFSGRSGFMGPLTAFYIAYYFLLVYYIRSSGPKGILVGQWSATLDYTYALEGPFFTLVLLLLVVPQITASLALLTLATRVEGREPRFRLVAVGLSIFVWFASALVGSLAQLSDYLAWQVTARMLGIAAAVVILLAYWPPKWLQEWFHERPPQTAAKGPRKEPRPKALPAA